MWPLKWITFHFLHNFVDLFPHYNIHNMLVLLQCYWISTQKGQTARKTVRYVDKSLERTFLQFNKLHKRIIIVNFIDHGSYITVTMTNNTKTEASKTPHNTVIQTKTQYCILERGG